MAGASSTQIRSTRPTAAKLFAKTPAGEQDVRRYFAMALLAEALALRGELDGGDRVEQAHALVWLGRARARQGDTAGARAALKAARDQLPALGGSLLGPIVQALEQDLAAQQPPGEAPGLNEPLTAAELRVLRLFPGDLSHGGWPAICTSR